MTFRHGFKVQANRIAVEVRGDLGLLPTSPLDQWQVCDHLDIEVFKLSELSGPKGEKVGRHFLEVEKEMFSGMVLPLGIRTAIVHNDAHVPVRQRSNLFHELSHLFLGHPIDPLVSADGTINRDRAIEDEAAFLGGCLAIPNEAACHIVNLAMQASAARMYQVSPAMLNFRLQVSGAIQIAARRARKQITAK